MKEMGVDKKDDWGWRRWVWMKEMNMDVRD